MPGPIPYVWHDGSMVPKNHFWLARANERYAEGEPYTLDDWQPRSRASHNQYFASIHEAWQNLPEDVAERYPTDEHLRKRALIKAGYRNERELVASSKAEAQRIAAFIKPKDEYALVVVRECVVIEYTAKSQSLRAMGKEDFQASKQAVLDILATMIGIDTNTLAGNAGEAA